MRRACGVVAASLALAGCGSTTSLSTRQLRARATRVCSAARLHTDRIVLPTSPAGGEAFLSAGIRALEPELGQLRALRAPKDLADQYSDSLKAFAAKVAALHDGVRMLAAGGDPVITIKTLQHRLVPLEVQEDGDWQSLDIPACLNS